MCTFNSIHINKCQIRITDDFVEFWGESGQVLITKLSIPTITELSKTVPPLCYIISSIFGCSDLVAKSLAGALQPFLK
jgi:hypothetical protein